jgi:hypothetical protein
MFIYVTSRTINSKVPADRKVATKPPKESSLFRQNQYVDITPHRLVNMRRVNATANTGDMKPAAKRARQEPEAEVESTGHRSSPPRNHADESNRQSGEAPLFGTEPMPMGGQRDSSTASPHPQNTLAAFAAAHGIDVSSPRVALPWTSAAQLETYSPAANAAHLPRDAASTSTEGNYSVAGLREGALNHFAQLQYDLLGQARIHPAVTASFLPAIPSNIFMGNLSMDALSLAMSRGLVTPVELLAYGHQFSNSLLQPQQQVQPSSDFLNLQQALLGGRSLNQPRPAVHNALSLTTALHQATGVESIGEILGSSGDSKRRVVPVSLPSDRETLSEYQCLLREQIVFFEATVDDIEATAQGRNKPIKVGQVGILCKHCARLAAGYRPRGAVYFPARLNGIYQAAQNQATNHFSESCRTIPEPLRTRAMMLKEQKTVVLGGGKQYWARAAEMSGVGETENGLAFTPRDSASLNPSDNDDAAVSSAS